MTRQEALKLGRDIRRAMRKAKGTANAPAMERLLKAHKEMFHLGLGAEAVVAVKGQQMRLEAAERGITNYMGVVSP